MKDRKIFVWVACFILKIAIQTLCNISMKKIERWAASAL